MEPQKTSQAIIQVNRKDYVPEGIKVRAWVTDSLYTADLVTITAEELRTNPLVKSVSLPQKLQLVG